MATKTKTYAQLAREIEALQASAHKARASEMQGAIASINQTIALYGLTAEDLRFEGVRSESSPAPASGFRQAKAASSPGASAAKSSEAKFSDGKGQVWSGRGPRPIWLRNALLQGRTLESFAVSASTPASGASGKTTATKGTPAKGARAEPVAKLPALFQHAKTGKTWSGRGPQPAWLKQGLKKRGATLEDFRIPQPEASSSAPETPAAPVTEPAKAPVAATKKRSAAKKAAAAKKAPAAKKTTAGAAASPAATAPAKKAAAKKSAAPAKASSPAAPAKKSAPAKKAAPAKTASLAEKIASKSTKSAGKATPAKKTPSKPADNSAPLTATETALPEAVPSSTVPEASPSPV